MFFIYSDSKVPYSGIPTPYNELPATKLFMTHFSNFLYLKFIHDATKDGNEKRRANHEIQIADKKMNYWKKHPNWNKEACEKMMAEEKRKWK